MADTRRTLAALAALFADNTAGAISAQDLRDFLTSTFPHVTTTDPTTGDDETDGFDRGSMWINTTTPAVFECLDPTTSTAVWVQVYPAVAAAVDAGDVDYENTTSGLTADDVQAAIDEIVVGLGTAAAADTGDFATSSQGGLADSAVQPGDPLTDLASTGASSGYVPKADGSGGISWGAESGGGADTFLELTDAPSSYSGQGGKVVAVKSDASGLEFISGGGGSGIDPSDGLVVVVHGDNASESRPTAGVVLWRGSADPSNAAAGDMWDDSEDWD